MDRVLVRHRTDNGQAIGDLRNFWQPFADLKAMHRGVDGLHLTLDLSRCQRLGIERFVLRGRTEQKYENARLGSWFFVAQARCRY